MQADSKNAATGSGKARSSRKIDDDFESVAKRLECDEDKKRFEEKLGKLAKAKPKGK